MRRCAWLLLIPAWLVSQTFIDWAQIRNPPIIPLPAPSPSGFAPGICIDSDRLANGVVEVSGACRMPTVAVISATGTFTIASVADRAASEIMTIDAPGFQVNHVIACNEPFQPPLVTVAGRVTEGGKIAAWLLNMTGATITPGAIVVTCQTEIAIN